jgi:hypothetical protein
MFVDVLYRAGDGKRHGWRVNVRTDARPYAVTVWGQPEFYGLNVEKAMTEALCRTTPTCNRIIVLIWHKPWSKKQILVGKCKHPGRCKTAILTQAAV